MDGRLTDLDALALTVRNPFSRTYIDEAVKAYRAGSCKAAIVAVWVAVTFDIIAKIRELAGQGDAQAISFVNAWDTNVQANNVERLLAMERELLTKADTDFGFIDSIARRHFERLQADRHLCAHPAFTSEGELFSPEPELVRLYLVEAIRNLLSQRPVQGRTLLALFDTEFRSLAFPTQPVAITRFVRERYLQHARRGAPATLATVLGKAMLRAAPAGWESKIGLLPHALQAVREVDRAAWLDSVVPALVNLIDTADDTQISNSYALLAVFTELQAALPGPTLEKLSAYLQNLAPGEADVRPFDAVRLPRFRDLMVEKFVRSSEAVQGAVLTRLAAPEFWPTALAVFSNSGSYRGAEARFERYIAPYQDTATPEQMEQVFAAVGINLHIYHAAEVPFQLADFVGRVGRRESLSQQNLTALVAMTDASPRNRRAPFRPVFEIFETAGLSAPPFTPQDDD
ncbi:hypothetical protein [Mesorhizobium sp. L2C084A000]|uniref:hypothetical protein n=1 Tax=Mesorhizobium sp. L2C084A000 TaxID=1287116 RepID=UPI0003CFB05A|nr:hypothetical protein [Mesorhizobium sp. L2C084A000]ESZ22821.1 hypothetical protein X734_28660 [Mesorhizobium sp. L2C084A000]